MAMAIAGNGAVRVLRDQAEADDGRRAVRRAFRAVDLQRNAAALLAGPESQAPVGREPGPQLGEREHVARARRLARVRLLVARVVLADRGGGGGGGPATQSQRADRVLLSACCACAAPGGRASPAAPAPAPADSAAAAAADSPARAGAGAGTDDPLVRMASERARHVRSLLVRRDVRGLRAAVPNALYDSQVHRQRFGYE